MHIACTPSTSNSNVIFTRHEQKLVSQTVRSEDAAAYYARLAAHASCRPPTRSQQHAQEYKFSGEVGRGSYGVVYRGKNSQGREVAIKVLQIDEDEGLNETCVRETALLQELNEANGHPNILRVLDVVVCEHCVYLTTDLLDLDLRGWIKSTPTSIRVQAIRKIATNVLNGLLYCHKRGIMHRDLKPQNILMSKDLRRIKLGDFGLARYMHDARKTLTHEVVTLWYRAPEVLLGECQYNESIDIWAAGCVLAEIWTGRPLFGGDSEIDTLFKIFVLLGTPLKSDWPEHAFEQFSMFPKFKGAGLESAFLRGTEANEATQSFLSLLADMLNLRPSQRADALSCLNHPFLSDLSSARALRRAATTNT